MTNHPLTISEISSIKILRSEGRSFNAIARKINRDPKTVKRCCQEPRNAEEIRSLQQEIASFFEDLTMRLLTSISDADIEKMNGQSRFVSAGIAVDKLRLLRGDSTENISIDVLNANIKDRARRRFELQEELQLTEVTTDEKELESKADNQE